jgi:hypothetical protein
MRCVATGKGEIIIPWFEIRILQGDVWVGFCTESAADRLLLGAKPGAGIYVHCCNHFAHLKLSNSPRTAPGVVRFGLSDQFSLLLVNGRVIISTCGAPQHPRNVRYHQDEVR